MCVIAAKTSDGVTPPGQVVLGTVFYSFAAAIFLGRFPGSILFMILASRENNRRATGPVLAQFAEYWQDRTQAAWDLHQGQAQSHEVLDRIWYHHIPLDD